jgi:hypothetical protein
MLAVLEFLDEIVQVDIGPEVVGVLRSQINRLLINNQLLVDRVKPVEFID